MCVAGKKAGAKKPADEDGDEEMEAEPEDAGERKQGDNASWASVCKNRILYVAFTF